MSFVSERSAVAADGLGRSRTDHLQDNPDKGRRRWVVDTPPVGAARSSRHTVPGEEEHPEEVVHALRAEEGRGTEGKVHPEEEDLEAEGRGRWGRWATEHERSCWAPVAGRRGPNCPALAAEDKLVDRCHG
jgi:hypothetical protein